MAPAAYACWRDRPNRVRISPVLGPVAFFGVLIAPRAVEIAGFILDEDYRNNINDDPED